ncbi:hypothetical protein CSQ86_09555 [Bifidobacterium felsineum]|uniref:Uncharacterized protein n=1 Tax=Bifidobacterium felsineum TaxID=2045440 RepID=A0A2M9HHW0_9BIFI|nr:hypothetical protein CSQ86_09555 [Bifidobacterium felsineum]
MLQAYSTQTDKHFFGFFEHILHIKSIMVILLPINYKHNVALPRHMRYVYIICIMCNKKEVQ